MGVYEIYAIEYASRMAKPAELLLRAAEETPVKMSYFFWAVTGPGGAVVVDAGFSREAAAKRGRSLYRDLGEGLSRVGIDPGQVETVVLTHFHADHVGNLDLFPRATFLAQERELAFWTGPYAGYSIFREIMEPGEIARLKELRQAGRLVLVDGQKELRPGLRLHLVGGHTAGTQILEVRTARGRAVIASDAVKTDRNLKERRPDPYLHDAPGMLDGYELIAGLADSPDLILPGHDPAVLDRMEKTAPGIGRLA